MIESGLAWVAPLGRGAVAKKVLDSQLVLAPEVPQRTQTRCKGHAARKGVVQRNIGSTRAFWCHVRASCAHRSDSP